MINIIGGANRQPSNRSLDDLRQRWHGMRRGRA
jgi:hypothetical protein